MKTILTTLLISLSVLILAQNKSFKVDDKVEVLYKQKWYPAKVLEVKDEGYLIHYDGYQSSWDEVVGDDRIRAVNETITSEKINETPKEDNTESNSTTSPKFKEGDIVEVQYRDDWIEGTITRYSETDEKYYVRLKEGGMSTYTEDKVRLLGWPENTCSNKETLYKIGDKVDAYWERFDKWFDATVLEAKEGQYLIHFIGKEANNDQVLNNDQVREWTKKETVSSNNNSNSSSGSDKSTITLKNTCGSTVVMYVNYERYSISSGYTVDVEITGDVTIYTEINGSKKSVGTASVGGSKTQFNSICN